MRFQDLDNADETTRRIYREAAIMSVFFQARSLETLRPALATMGVVMAPDLRRVKAGQTVLVKGILVIVRTPPTTPGEGIIFIAAEEGMGLLEVVAFPKVLDKYACVIRTSGVLIVNGRLQRQVNWDKSPTNVMARAVVPWSALLSELLLKEFS